MADIALDLNPLSETFQDLLVVNGDLVLTSGTGAIQQHILQRLRIFYGEWFLDQSIGVPYFQQIFIKGPNQATIDGIFLGVILATPGVIAVTKYSFTPDPVNRQLSVSFSAQCTTGTVNYNGLLDV